MSKLHKDILKKLFEARVTSRRTQKEIGNLVGVSHPMIGYWEKGKYQPNLGQFISWCYALQLIPELKNQHTDGSYPSLPDQEQLPNSKTE